MSAEIELKLEIPAGSIGRLNHSPLLKNAAAERKSAVLQSVYFDTSKQTLRRHGLLLRIRRSGARRVQTVKQDDGHGAGLFSRGEWECDVAADRPDFDAARRSALGPLLTGKLCRRLRPVFATRVRREVYPLERRGSTIELTIDKGEIETAERAAPICEIELELKDGQPAALFDVAQALAREVPVELAAASKAARGYALLAGEAPGPVKAEPVRLDAATSQAQAFQIIARACLHQMLANVPGLRSGDLDALHELRIGLRRMRVAMSLFKAMLAGRQTDAMKAAFRRAGEQLGPARELDVFIKGVVSRAENGGGGGRIVRPLAADLRAQRTQALARAQQTVASQRFRTLMLDAAAWIEIGDWTRSDDDLVRLLREQPAALVAAEELRRRRKKMRKRGAHLATLDPRRRHKLRIQAKKLRYACEFFAGAFPGRKAQRRRRKFLARLKALQDELGDLNDIVVHEGITARFLHAGANGGKARRERVRNVVTKAFAAGRLAGREEERFAAAMKDAEQAFAGFAAAKPFWS